MSESLNIDIVRLTEYTDAVDALLVEASDQMRMLGAYENAPDDHALPEYGALLERFEQVQAVASEYAGVFYQWNEQALTMLQASEVTRSLGQCRRLNLVLVNILRICRNTLGIADPQQMQDEMSLQMMRMNAMHKE